MSRTLRRALGATVVATVLAAALLPPTTIGRAQAQSAGPTGTCAGGRTVLLLMDTSGSLPTTDPDDRRIASAKDWVKLQSRIARSEGATITFGLSTFGTASLLPDRTYELPRDAAEVEGALDALAGLKSDQNTDFIAAFQNGIEFFRSRAGAGAGCNLLFVFTDGAYSIDAPSAPAVRGYTASTTKEAIQGEFDAQVCGPLPPTSRLAEPLSTSIRNAGFAVQIQELTVASRSGGFNADQERTIGVFNRLFASDPSESCRVSGPGRSAQADGPWPPPAPLVPLACDKLNGAVPISLVRSVVARAENEDAQISAYLDGQRRETDRGILVYRPSPDTPRSGLLTVKVEPAGRLAYCYADLAGDIEFGSENRVFAGASKSFVTARVAGRGLREPDSAIDERVVELRATVDGQPAPVRFDPNARNWRIEVPGPRTTPPQIQVKAVAAPGWDFTGEIATKPTSLTLVDNPLPPDLTLAGDRRFEGRGPFSPEWVVEPKSQVGGELCVTVESPIRVGEGARFVTKQREVCGSDSGPFRIPTRLVVPEALNRATTVKVPFDSTVTPTGSGAIDLAPSTATVERVTLAKPADAGSTVVLVVLMVLASILLSLGTLLALTNRARRLPDPGRFTAVPVSLTRDPDGALSVDESRPVEVAHIRPVAGDRSGIDAAGGYRLSKKWTFNPFAGLVARASNSGGPLGAYPDGHIGDGAVPIPVSFKEMVLIDPSAQRAVVIMPKGMAAPAATALVRDVLPKFNRDAAGAATDTGSKEPGDGGTGGPPRPPGGEAPQRLQDGLVRPPRPEPRPSGAGPGVSDRPIRPASVPTVPPAAPTDPRPPRPDGGSGLTPPPRPDRRP
jgi:hypothetical protein